MRDRGQARAPRPQGRHRQRRRRLPHELPGARDGDAAGDADRERRVGEPAVRLDRLEAGQQVRRALRGRLHEPGLRQARRGLRDARLALRGRRGLRPPPAPRADARRPVAHRRPDRLLRGRAPGRAGRRDGRRPSRARRSSYGRRPVRHAGGHARAPRTGPRRPRLPARDPRRDGGQRRRVPAHHRPTRSRTAASARATSRRRCAASCAAGPRAGRPAPGAPPARGAARARAGADGADGARCAGAARAGPRLRAHLGRGRPLRRTAGSSRWPTPRWASSA